MEHSDRRSERYLELLGVAADAFLDATDLEAWLARLRPLFPREPGELLALYHPEPSGSARASVALDDDPARAATALRVLQSGALGIDPYLTLVTQTRETLVVSEIDASRAFEGDEPSHALAQSLDRSSMMLVPVMGLDATLGIILFLSGKDGRRYDRIDLEFARDLGKLAAFALDNATLVDRAGQVLDELRFLGDVGETMVESLDLGTRLDRFLQAVVPRLADWATVNLLEDDGSIETLAIAHRDPAKAPILERLRGPYYGNVETNQGTPVALRSGRPRLLTGVDDDFLRRHIRPETFEDVRALGADASFIVPLIAHGRTYGTLSAMRSERERPFVEREMWLIEELARRAAVAIANAKLFERSATVADAFQQASLPAKLPRTAGVTFSAFYAAGRSEATVGGDWYDAFARGDGSLVVSIGDVAGSGLRAAVIMACVRQLVRGAAQVQSDPGAVLDAADRALRDQHPDAIVTAFVGVIDPEARRITYASAGHPPPLLRTDGGEILELATVGLPLGLRGSGESRTTVQPCGAGSILLLYTDGLTESTRDILEGERRLREAFAALRVDRTPELAKVLHDALLHEGAHDDVALLTARFS